MTLGRSVRDGRNRRRSRLSSAAAAAEKAEAAAERGNRKGEREGGGPKRRERKANASLLPRGFLGKRKGEMVPSPLSGSVVAYHAKREEGTGGVYSVHS